MLVHTELGKNRHKSTMKKITPQELVCMDEHAEKYGFRVELAYAREDNFLFGERIYRKGAKLFLHKDLAAIVFYAARLVVEKYHVRFVLYDGLRTTDAQAKMIATRRVRENPQWLEEPRLLSPPGAGGHPRGMAIDIGLETLEGELMDMGTVFDFLAEKSDAAHNPAHRDYKGHGKTVTENRNILDDCIRHGAAHYGLPLFPLPEEWWDFRFPRSVYEEYAPLSDSDLPPDLRLVDV